MQLCIQVDTVFRFFIEKTAEFDKWLRKLKDLKAKEIWKKLKNIEKWELRNMT
jgi:putative component of toxin-antitoxin plasmid stabilization module